jgi:CheY-like chemotaxis protein/HPt (histidine-containing phosphotransfer) domain-containing protein
LFDTLARLVAQRRSAAADADPEWLQPPSPASNTAPLAAGHPNGTRPLILVAEDAAVNQMVVRGLLEKLGYRADVVGNGLEAVEALSRISYRAVLMDVQMPEMDGFEATAQIRSRESGTTSHVPIIALTANAMAGERERCLAAGMDDYVSKPVREMELSAALRRWVAPAETPAGDAAAPPVQPAATETTTDRAVLDPVRLAELRQMQSLRPDVDIIGRLFATYRRETERRLTLLHEALAANNAADVERLGHAQKGSSGTLGALEMHDLAEQLELLGQSGSLASAEALIGRLEAAFGRLGQAFADRQP